MMHKTMYNINKHTHTHTEHIRACCCKIAHKYITFIHMKQHTYSYYCYYSIIYKMMMIFFCFFFSSLLRLSFILHSLVFSVCECVWSKNALLLCFAHSHDAFFSLASLCLFSFLWVCIAIDVASSATLCGVIVFFSLWLRILPSSTRRQRQPTMWFILLLQLFLWLASPSRFSGSHAIAWQTENGERANPKSCEMWNQTKQKPTAAKTVQPHRRWQRCWRW